MGMKFITESILQNIADAIRSKTGGTGAITPANMAAEISNIQTGSDTIDDVLISKTATKYENGTATSLPDYCLYHADGLTELDLPNVETLGNYSLAYVGETHEIEEVTFPKLKQVGKYAFQNAYIKKLNMPALEKILSDGFNSLARVTELTLPATLTSMMSSTFMNSGRLQKIVFEGQVPSIPSSAFANCPLCTEYDFSHCTTIPTLSNVNAFRGINANAVIKVPAALETQWKQETNWVTYASQIQGV